MRSDSLRSPGVFARCFLPLAVPVALSKPLHSALRKLALLSWALGLASLLSACGGGGGQSSSLGFTPNPSPTPSLNPSTTLASITVSPASPAVILGGSQTLTATATYLDGSTRDITSAVTWTSGSTAIASVDASGSVTGTGVGRSTITASLDGVAGEARFGVFPGWNFALSNVSAPGENATLGRVAVSADGTQAIAVWSRCSCNGTIVQTASASMTGNTMTWGPTTDLSGPDEQGLNPDIALSADGTRAIAVWEAWDGFNFVIESASATLVGTTATWSSTTDLSASGHDAFYSKVALAADGTHATAVWKTYDGSNDIVQSASATITDNSATWGSPTKLSDGGNNASGPQISLSSDGTRAVVVWQRNNGYHEIAQAACAVVTGTTATWGSGQDLSDLEQDADRQRVTLSADGTHVAAVWQQWDGAVYSSHGKLAILDGNNAIWSSNITFSTDGNQSFSPAIALSTDGSRATAVWEQYDGTRSSLGTISATIVGNTATWGAPTHLTEPGLGFVSPFVGLSADGTKATSWWYVSDDVNTHIQTASATVTGTIATWGTITDLTTIDGNPSCVQGALSGDGTRCTAVWQRSDGTNTIIQASSYYGP